MNSLPLPTNNRWAALSDTYHPPSSRRTQLTPEPRRSRCPAAPTKKGFVASDFPALSSALSSASGMLVSPLSLGTKMTDLFSESSLPIKEPDTKNLIYRIDPVSRKIIREDPPPPPPSLSDTKDTLVEDINRALNQIRINHEKYREGYNFWNPDGYGYENFYYPSPVDSEEDNETDTDDSETTEM